MTLSPPVRGLSFQTELANDETDHGRLSDIEKKSRMILIILIRISLKRKVFYIFDKYILIQNAH